MDEVYLIIFDPYIPIYDLEFYVEPNINSVIELIKNNKFSPLDSNREILRLVDVKKNENIRRRKRRMCNNSKYTYNITPRE